MSPSASGKEKLRQSTASGPIAMLGRTQRTDYTWRSPIQPPTRAKRRGITESPQHVSEILSPELPDNPDPARARITAAWSRDETEAVNELLVEASFAPAEREQVLAAASDLVARIRAKADNQSAVESFMREYDLSSEEGVLLMCVAEALLRVPDAETADKLIRDKLGDANWKKHVGASESLFVNASTWGLMLTGELVQLAEETRSISSVPCAAWSVAPENR